MAKIKSTGTKPTKVPTAIKGGKSPKLSKYNDPSVIADKKKMGMLPKGMTKKKGNK